MKKLPFVFFFSALFLFVFLKTNSSFVSAQEENLEEPEVIIPKQSFICTDFMVNVSKESQAAGSENSSGDSRENKNQVIKGDIKLEDIKQPDFSLMNEYLKSALPKFLPITLTGKVNIKTKNLGNLESRELHLIYGDQNLGAAPQVYWGDDIGESELFPGTKIKNPDWWTSLLGQSRIFCGILTKDPKICEAPKKLNLAIEQPEFETGNSTETNPDLKHQLIGMKFSDACVKTNPVLGQKSELEDAGTKFVAGSFFQIIKEKIQEIINGIRNFFIRTQETTELRNASWGYLTGGASLATESAFFASFIPYNIDSQIGNSPLAGDSSYQVQVDGYDASISDETLEDAKKNNFQGQNLPRARYCLQICSLYPLNEKFNVSNIDPICISCNPKDYQNLAK